MLYDYKDDQYRQRKRLPLFCDDVFLLLKQQSEDRSLRAMKKKVLGCCAAVQNRSIDVDLHFRHISLRRFPSAGREKLGIELRLCRRRPVVFMCNRIFLH